jgi:hypothetical protein
VPVMWRASEVHGGGWSGLLVRMSLLLVLWARKRAAARRSRGVERERTQDQGGREVMFFPDFERAIRIFTLACVAFGVLVGLGLAFAAPWILSILGW